MAMINVKLTAREADTVVSALKLWGKTRYSKQDKMFAHDLIDKVFDAVDNVYAAEDIYTGEE